MSYEALFARRTAGVRLGLEIVGKVYDAMGRPAAGIPAVHIVGTNGKGSVAALIAGGLEALGRRVGLYTSPHLVEVTERVRVGGVPVADETLRSAIDAVLAHEAPDLARPLSFFEVLTLAALKIFADAGVDLIVAEAGLGGRLDATRLVDAAVVAVTSIDLDHQAWLGPDLASIAREKVAVFRPEVPVVTGPQPPEVAQIIREQAREVGAPWYEVEPWPEPPKGWKGEHQRHNAAIALKAARCLEPRLNPEDFDGVLWPGRMQELDWAEGRVILDVAHNRGSVAALVDTLQGRLPSDAAVLFGCAADKEVGVMLEALRRLQRPLWFVPPPGIAAAEVGPDEVDEWFSRFMPEAWSRCERWVQEGKTVVVCGSHMLVGAVLARLQGRESPDPSDPMRPDAAPDPARGSNEQS